MPAPARPPTTSPPRARSEEVSTAELVVLVVFGVDGDREPSSGELIGHLRRAGFSALEARGVLRASPLLAPAASGRYRLRPCTAPTTIC
jgi:hypothetical protein